MILISILTYILFWAFLLNIMVSVYIYITYILNVILN